MSDADARWPRTKDLDLEFDRDIIERERARIAATTIAFEQWGAVSRLLETHTLSDAVPALATLLGISGADAHHVLDTQLSDVTIDQRRANLQHLEELEQLHQATRPDPPHHGVYYVGSLEEIDTPVEAQDLARATCHVCDQPATTFGRFGPQPVVIELGDGVFLCDDCLFSVWSRDTATLHDRLDTEAEDVSGIAEEIVNRAENFYRPTMR